MSKAQAASRVSPGRPPLPPPPYPPNPARETRPWIVNALLVLLVLLALGALVGLIVVLAAQGRRPAIVIAGKPEEAAPAVSVAPAPLATVLASKPPDEARPETKPPEPPAAGVVNPPQQAAPPTAPDPEPAPLEAVGVLTGVHLYQTHLSIGLLADAAESDVYTTEDADKLLEGITGMMDTVAKELALIPDDSLKPADRQALLKVKDLTGLLRTQAAELRAYWNTGEKEHADNYHKARNQAWEGVKELLNIEE